MTDKKKKLVLLDVHAILHRAYHALPDFVTSKGEPTGGLYGLSTMLIKIIDDLKPDEIIACYDLPKPTYRHEAYEGYKAGRAKADDALVSQIIASRELFKALNIPAFEVEGFEADDLIGTLAIKAGATPDWDVVIASGDMDTLQLVTGKKIRVYTLKKGIKDTIIYDEDGVKERYGFTPKLLVDYKGLRGDPSDNIIGIKGIGEKTATELIQHFGTIEEMYKKLKKDKQAFLDAGIKERIIGLLEEGEEDAKFSKMLGTIRLDAPVEFKPEEIDWKNRVVVETATNLWNKWEFRTLTNRLKDVLKHLGMEVSKEDEKTANLGWENIPADELKETLIVLWLLNSGISNPQLDDLKNYNGGFKTFAEAKEAVFAELEEKKLTKVWLEIEKPLMPVVDRMNANGVLIDKENLVELSKKYHKELADKEKEIWKLAGMEFNIASPKQVGEVLFEKLELKVKGQKKTASGSFSTKESELEKMKDLHPIIAWILEYRELAKLLSTYIDNIPNLLDAKNRLHTNFIQAGTTTGRMASQEPNLQNIPNKTDLGRIIRQAFIARPGASLVSFDYSQIELRIAAFLSRDEKMLEIFRSGEDIHTAVASEVFGIAREEVTKEMRRRAKVINFGIIYGMGITALKDNLGTDRAEAQKFYDDYFKNFSRLAAYLDETKAFAYETGYTETAFGRRRYFEGLKSKLPFIRASAERMATNAPIQGTEADIVKIAMIKIDEYLVQKKWTDKVELILQVHDELVYEVEDGLIKEVEEKIKEIMEDCIDTKITLGVRCVAEAKVGKNWGQME
ncbi:MAG: DNA polymerase [bacterium]